MYKKVFLHFFFFIKKLCYGGYFLFFNLNYVKNFSIIYKSNQIGKSRIFTRKIIVILQLVYMYDHRKKQNLIKKYVNSICVKMDVIKGLYDQNANKRAPPYSTPRKQQPKSKQDFRINDT